MTQLAKLICIAISFAVVLGGLHGKDLLNLPQRSGADHMQDTHHDVGSALQGDPHFHPDKVFKLTSDGPQTDARSLRLLQSSRRSINPHRWQGMWQGWRDSLALYLGERA